MATSTINTITLSGSVTNSRYVASPGDVYRKRRLSTVWSRTQDPVT